MQILHHIPQPLAEATRPTRLRGTLCGKAEFCSRKVPTLFSLCMLFRTPRHTSLPLSPTAQGTLHTRAQAYTHFSSHLPPLCSGCRHTPLPPSLARFLPLWRKRCSSSLVSAHRHHGHRHVHGTSVRRWPIIINLPHAHARTPFSIANSSSLLFWRAYHLVVSPPRA